MTKKSNLILAVYFLILATIPVILAVSVRNKILAGDVINETQLEKQRFIHFPFSGKEHITVNGIQQLLSINIQTDTINEVVIDTNSAKVISLLFEGNALIINYDFNLDTTLNKRLAKKFRLNQENSAADSELLDENYDYEYIDDEHQITVKMSLVKSILSNNSIVDLRIDSNNISMDKLNLDLNNSKLNMNAYYYETVSKPSYVSKINANLKHSNIDFSSNIEADEINLKLVDSSRVIFSKIKYNVCNIERDLSSGGAVEIKELNKLNILTLP